VPFVLYVLEKYNVKIYSIIYITLYKQIIKSSYVKTPDIRHHLHHMCINVHLMFCALQLGVTSDSLKNFNVTTGLVNSATGTVVCVLYNNADCSDLFAGKHLPTYCQLCRFTGLSVEGWLQDAAISVSTSVGASVSRTFCSCTWRLAKLDCTETETEALLESLSMKVA